MNGGEEKKKTSEKRKKKGQRKRICSELFKTEIISNETSFAYLCSGIVFVSPMLLYISKELFQAAFVRALCIEKRCMLIFHIEDTLFLKLLRKFINKEFPFFLCFFSSLPPRLSYMTAK